ncbi:MAG: sulfatase-like hydrolase/transferase [Clostridia bacterium]|nr:sulfatase-like hydrolase/transferase [Clostridia bacterium]
MFIEFSIERKKEYWLLSLLASVLYVLLGVAMDVDMDDAVKIGILLLAVLNLRIHFKDNTPAFIGPMIAAVFSFIIFYEVQLAVGATIDKLTFLLIFLNFLIVFGIVLFAASACGNLSWALVGVNIVLVTLGIANNFVVQSRGVELQFSDLFSIGTAAAVAGGYKFTLASYSVTAIMLTVVQVLFFSLNHLPKFKKLPLRITSLSTGTVSLLLVIALISTTTGASAIGFQLKSWKLQPSTYNGFLLNLLHSVSATTVDAPDGYSREELDQMINSYYPNTPPVTDNNTSKPPETQEDPVVPDTDETAETKKPNIIVIMNETFSDLTALSAALEKEMTVTTPVLPFFSSLSDDAPNIAKGNAMASVFGGNTANSEFEFLTANTMAFLPQNTVAYSIYLNETNCFSVLDIMEAAGYRTIAMHPQPGANWKRNQIYSYYGFDETYFLETQENGAQTFVNNTPITDAELYRTHVSDRTTYERIIELYENKEEGESIFTFAITMQNHGGYKTSAFDYTVNMQSPISNSQVDEYLSSVQNSDAALQELIEYFEAQEEETLIIMFGDHQPSLPDSFYSQCWGLTEESTTEELQAKYVIPYLYWGNFDFEAELGDLTSINYLSSHMLDIAGIEKTRFMELLDAIESEIPAINSFGWWDAELNFHSFAAEDSDMVQELRLYKYLQYNRLFDLPEDKLTDLFLPAAGVGDAEQSGIIPAYVIGKEEE